MTIFLSDSDPIALTSAEQRIGAKAHDFNATYQRYINTAGVPVKRLILTGDEEVDNAALQAAS